MEMPRKKNGKKLLQKKEKYGTQLQHSLSALNQGTQLQHSKKALGSST